MATAKMPSFTIPLYLLPSEALSRKQLLSRTAFKLPTQDQADPGLFMKCYGFAKIKSLISALPITK